ncbi:STE/STE7 protein kinase [Fonticula alba]|uniref:mitogen-activated protein kinase kinase n=1 Tax=Fonticula alba TaxID=691883 RepID=A0A058ZFI1_FONAL|nr:STE/STE7 protein kinase [Fonticula alba]KCV72688.1 STE/STE7 protein kinase [Fonticula alba]|eukprot:XP_009492389.1 STE/STE7 protein kinase [Fonticula alba]
MSILLRRRQKAALAAELAAASPSGTDLKSDESSASGGSSAESFQSQSSLSLLPNGGAPEGTTLADGAPSPDHPRPGTGGPIHATSQHPPHLAGSLSPDGLLSASVSGLSLAGSPSAGPSSLDLTLGGPGSGLTLASDPDPVYPPPGGGVAAPGAPGPGASFSSPGMASQSQLGLDMSRSASNLDLELGRLAPAGGPAGGPSGSLAPVGGHSRSTSGGVVLDDDGTLRAGELTLSRSGLHLASSSSMALSSGLQGPAGPPPSGIPPGAAAALAPGSSAFATPAAYISSPLSQVPPHSFADQSLASGASSSVCASHSVSTSSGELLGPGSMVPPPGGVPSPEDLDALEDDGDDGPWVHDLGQDGLPRRVPTAALIRAAETPLAELGRGAQGRVTRALVRAVSLPVAIKIIPLAALLPQADGSSGGLGRPGGNAPGAPTAAEKEAENPSRLLGELRTLYDASSIDYFHGSHLDSTGACPGGGRTCLDSASATQYPPPGPGDGREQIVRFWGAFVADGHAHVALELMDGGSLADLSARWGGPLPERILRRITRETLKGLAYLHAPPRRRLHRDLKPSNVLCDARGRVALADFGVVSGALAASMASCASWVGTVTYMSPERIQGRSYSFASDIWALGLSILELALGRFPYAPVPPADPMMEVPVPEHIHESHATESLAPLQGLDPSNQQNLLLLHQQHQLQQQQTQRPQAAMLEPHHMDPYAGDMGAPEDANYFDPYADGFGGEFDGHGEEFAFDYGYGENLGEGIMADPSSFLFASAPMPPPVPVQQPAPTIVGLGFWELLDAIVYDSIPTLPETHSHVCFPAPNPQSLLLSPSYSPQGDDSAPAQDGALPSEHIRIPSGPGTGPRSHVGLSLSVDDTTAPLADCPDDSLPHRQLHLSRSVGSSSRLLLNPSGSDRDLLQQSAFAMSAPGGGRIPSTFSPARQPHLPRTYRVPDHQQPMFPVQPDAYHHPSISLSPVSPSASGGGPSASNVVDPSNSAPAIWLSPYGEDLRDFIMLCLQKDPAQRPSALQLLKHPFVNGPEVATAEDMAIFVRGLVDTSVMGQPIPSELMRRHMRSTSSSSHAQRPNAGESLGMAAAPPVATASTGAPWQARLTPTASAMFSSSEAGPDSVEHPVDGDEAPTHGPPKDSHHGSGGGAKRVAGKPPSPTPEAGTSEVDSLGAEPAGSANKPPGGGLADQSVPLASGEGMPPSGIGAKKKESKNLLRRLFPRSSSSSSSSSSVSSSTSLATSSGAGAGGPPHTGGGAGGDHRL